MFWKFCDYDMNNYTKYIRNIRLILKKFQVLFNLQSNYGMIQGENWWKLKIDEGLRQIPWIKIHG